MDINNADDIELLVESMNWQTLPVDEVVEKLEAMNERELKLARHLVNQRVWDETFDDEMAAAARWHYMKKTSAFADAIWEWQKRETK